MALLLFGSGSLLAAVYTHDFGEVTLDETPQKVAALNWTQTEFLLSLGIIPAGVTTLKGYRYWQSDNPPLPEDGVSELGRGEPSFEALAALNPDLILGYNWRHGRMYHRLQAIAPTALYRQYPTNDDSRDYFLRMQANFRSVAELVNRREEAEKAIADMNSL